jgi:hypothetical protein
MGENGETTGGGGGPNTNPIEAIGEGDGVLEVQNKERCINWFCSKLTRVRDKKYHMVEIKDAKKKGTATSVQWIYKGYTAWGGPARICAHILGLRGKGVAAAKLLDDEHVAACQKIEDDLASKASREVQRAAATAAARKAESARKQQSLHDQ